MSVVVGVDGVLDSVGWDVDDDEEVDLLDSFG